MGFPRQEYWSGLPFPSPGDLPDPGIEPSSPALAGWFFTIEPPGKPEERMLMLLLDHFSRVRLCDPRDGSPPGSSVPGILQARTLEWVAISFSSAWKWKVKVKPLSQVQLLATPWTAAHQAPPSMGFSRQEHWSVGCHCFLRKKGWMPSNLDREGTDSVESQIIINSCNNVNYKFFIKKLRFIEINERDVLSTLIF